MNLAGGCQCGAVRYQAQVDEPRAYYCHCRMCQKAFGNVFATFFNLPKAHVRWTTREPDWFASSKVARRGFCSRCGTPLSFEYHDSPRMDLSVGSLDDPGLMRPTEHFGVEARLPAFHHPDGLPEHRTTDSNTFVERWRQAYGEDPA